MTTDPHPMSYACRTYPSVLAKACPFADCPAVLDYGEDLIIIGKKLGPDTYLADGTIGPDEYAVRISRDLVIGALCAEVREQCAKIADRYANNVCGHTEEKHAAEQIAERIRSQGCQGDDMGDIEPSSGCVFTDLGLDKAESLEALLIKREARIAELEAALLDADGVLESVRLGAATQGPFTGISWQYAEKICTEARARIVTLAVRRQEASQEAREADEDADRQIVASKWLSPVTRERRQI